MGLSGMHLRPAACWLVMAMALPPAFAQSGSIDATIPVEVLEPDPALSRGEVAIGTDMLRRPGALAAQPARVARGAVIERRQGREEVLAMALLGQVERTADGRVDLDPPRERVAWCEVAISKFANFMGQIGVFSCFQDRDGDGAFETEYLGHGASDVRITLMSIDSAKARSPLPFRSARTEELPLFHVGYISCGRTAEKTAADVVDLRFGTYLRHADAKLAISACSEVATLLETRDGEKIYRVGRFTLGVREVDGALQSRLIEGIPPGTLLAHLRYNRPLLDATETATEIVEREKPTLYLDSIPHTADTVKAGENILEARVAHGITGRLRTDIKVRGWGARIAFTAGTPVFGVPMTQSSAYRESDTSMTWCVPGRDSKKQLQTHCFTGPGAYAVLRSFTPFMVEQLLGTPRYSESPIVDRGPVEFEGPLVLQVRLVRSTDDFIALETSVSYAGEPAWRDFRATIRDDGFANVALGGAVLRLRPGADRNLVSVEVIGTFEAGEPAIPIDVRFVTRPRSAG